MDRSDLFALQTFVAIAEQGSLRAAARFFGVNPPAVSSQLKAFETRLGTPLFLRSTRSVTLTDAGRALFDRSKHLLRALSEALDSAHEAQSSQSGTLKITLPFRAWQLIIAPKLSAFQAACPGVVLDLDVEEGLTDIIARGYHAGIRLGDRLQDNMIATRLSRVEKTAYVASPAYLRKFGMPNRPSDLLHHVCIRHRQVTSGHVVDWRFSTSEGEVSVDVNGSLILNDLRGVVDAAVNGFGIGWSLLRGVQKEVEKGQLIQILADFTPPRQGFSLYYPRALQQFGILRRFIEHFREEKSSG